MFPENNELSQTVADSAKMILLIFTHDKLCEVFTQAQVFHVKAQRVLPFVNETNIVNIHPLTSQ